MTKKKILMWMSLVVLALVAISLVCGCVSVATVSYSEKKVVLDGNIRMLAERPTYSVLNRNPAYIIYCDYGTLSVVKAGLGKGPIVVRDPVVMMKIEALKEKEGHYCEIIGGKVSGTDYWEVIDVKCA